MKLGICWTRAAKAAMPAMCGDIFGTRASSMRVLLLAMVVVFLYAATSSARCRLSVVYPPLWWVYNLSRLNIASATSIWRRNSRLIGTARQGPLRPAYAAFVICRGVHDSSIEFIGAGRAGLGQTDRGDGASGERRVEGQGRGLGRCPANPACLVWARARKHSVASADGV
jgi:hypothetical protein